MLSDLTALYTDLDIEYQQEYIGGFEDLSFRADEVEVIASLKDDLITGYGRPMVAVGEPSALKFHIERLYDTCRNIQYMDFLINGELSVVSQFLIRQGYSVKPYYTHIIDLTLPVEELKANLRKSYKSLVNKDSGLLKNCMVSDFREVHKKYHGETRSEKTWSIQNMMDTVCCVKDNTGAMFYGGKTAYYASAAGDNNHVCVWNCLLSLKEKGSLYAEMGEQKFNGNSKQVNISKFKRGFGGKCYTRLIIEKEK